MNDLIRIMSQLRNLYIQGHIILLQIESSGEEESQMTCMEILTILPSIMVNTLLIFHIQESPTTHILLQIMLQEK